MKNKELEEIIEKYDLIGKTHKEILKIVDENLLDWTVLAILSYISTHYALPKSAITELSKDENVREILVKYGLVEENKTVKVGWKKNPYAFNFMAWWDGEKYTFGFDSCGDWYDKINLSCPNLSENDYDATPEEIESMLIKKLEADGLKVGCMVERDWVLEKSHQIKEIQCLIYHYVQEDDCLICGSYTVYEKGKFAKIIQPELSDKEKLELMWEQFNSK